MCTTSLENTKKATKTLQRNLYFILYKRDLWIIGIYIVKKNFFKLYVFQQLACRNSDINLLINCIFRKIDRYGRKLVVLYIGENI